MQTKTVDILITFRMLPQRYIDFKLYNYYLFTKRKIYVVTGKYTAKVRNHR